MNTDSVNEIFGVYPEVCAQLKVIECGNGWKKILIDLLTAIREKEISDFTFVQIKEKFGLLRIYYDGPPNQELDILIQNAEFSSASICEACGEPNSVRSTVKGWIKTLCSKCAA